MNNHSTYIKEKLDDVIKKCGILKVGINLNNFFKFEDANHYAYNYVKNFKHRKIKDRARQEKSSKDSVLGKLVEEVIIYLLEIFFKNNNLNYLITNNKCENKIVKELIDALKIKRKSTNHEKHFDSDILIYNKSNYETTKKVFIVSAKGTTRERIGQFLSHLFLMDQDVLNAKYGNNKYEVIFTTKNINIKYAFVTLDWAENKDFIKFSKSGKIRKTVKNTEVQLILDDVKLGGGIYVLNNLENINGIGNFATLAGTICDYLK